MLGCAGDDRNVPVIDNPLQRPEVAMPTGATQEPGALVLVIDRSGSMQGAKLEAAKAASIAAVDALEDTDQVAMIVFDSVAQVLIPMQPGEPRTDRRRHRARRRPGAARASCRACRPPIRCCASHRRRSST